MLRRHPGLNRKVLVSLFSGNAVSGVLTCRRQDRT
jgi:small nuclear ribonucleoprotein (snRNP)-like protein